MPFTVFEAAERYLSQVDERLHRAAAALHRAGVPYAVIGGNAVMAWVAQVDKGAVRFTRDVDLLLSSTQFSEAKAALESAGFSYRRVASVEMFLDGPKGSARDAIRIVRAGEKVRADYPAPAPSLNEVVRSEGHFNLITLEALVRMKLTSFRLKDQVHLQDLVEVGLVDASWPARFPSPLSDRLQQIIENPEA